LYAQVFLYLQVLDFLTTLVGLRMGLQEGSPFIRALMEWGPEAGLFISKGIAVVLGGICIWQNRRHLLRWINYWYAGLVVWNLCLISIAQGRF